MRKLLSSLKQKSNTMLFRITFGYIIVTFAVVISIGVAVTTSVSLQLYQQIKSEAGYISERLEEEGVELIDQLAPLDQEEVFIQITDLVGNMIQSENMKKIPSDAVVRENLFLGPVMILGHSNIPYFKSTVETDAYYFEIFLNIEDNIEVIELILETLFIVAVVGLSLAVYVIYQLSKKINQPLSQMTQEINSEHLEVTVPSSPQELNELAQAFNQLGHMLEQKITRERQFISDASHELRTPLSAIRGHLNLIKRRGESHPEVVGPSLDFIDHESMRMQRLIEQLLLLSRLEDYPQELPTINLSRKLESIVSDYQFIFEQTFKREIEDGIIIKGNKDQIKQIVVSLIENAHKYTPKDGEIKLILKRRNEFAVIEVQDSGPGIADEEKQKIFERFYRVDPSRSSQISGSGLGLAITKQLTALNDGTIEVRDNHPKGSIFIVEFPLYIENTS